MTVKQTISLKHGTTDLNVVFRNCEASTFHTSPAGWRWHYEALGPNGEQLSGQCSEVFKDLIDAIEDYQRVAKVLV
jgi:hypothetical protein